MLLAMTKTMFANPKAALGFAGVTIAIAIAASFGASQFLPATDEEPQVAQPVEGAPTPAQVNQPPAAVAWADDGSDGGFTDDWDDSAVSSANGFNDDNGPGAVNEMEEPSFGDFSPQSRERSGAPAPRARASASSSAPRVVSRAAPDAPELQPPGGRGTGELVAVE